MPAVFSANIYFLPGHGLYDAELAEKSEKNIIVLREAQKSALFS